MATEMSLAFSMDDFKASLNHAVTRGYHLTAIGNPVMALFQDSNGVWFPATACGTQEKVAARTKGDSEAVFHQCPSDSKAVPIHADVVTKTIDDFKDVASIMKWAETNGPVLYQQMTERQPVPTEW